MSMTQTTLELSPSGDPHCPNCKAVLPPRATFCTSCGERIVRKNAVPLFENEADIATRYRITSLVRRRPYVSLFFAIDNQLQRPVAIREITIRGLDNVAHKTACELAQQEYDLLRREQIPSILPVIDLRHFQDRLYLVSSWPADKSEKTGVIQLHTLQDVLQSGIGLPDTSTTLAWIERLCSSLDHLHHHAIVIGDLDPQALVLSSNHYSGDLALMVSWQTAALGRLLPQVSSISHAANFSAPEALEGKPIPASDIYSLGAVLYLLLTGVPPDAPADRLQRRLRLPSEVNSRLSGHLDESVMKSLALESAERYQSANEMAEALFRSPSRGKRLAAKGTASTHQPTGEGKAGIPKTHDTYAAQSHKEEIVNIDTILITPLPETNIAAWQAAKAPERQFSTPAQETPNIVEREAVQLPSPPVNATTSLAQRSDSHADKPSNTFADSFRKRVTGILPAVPRSQVPKAPDKVRSSATTSASLNPAAEAASDKDKSFIKQLQRLLLGEQKHSTTAAAIIETPMRVQPDQSYSIRIQLMGRDQPTLEPEPSLHPAGKKTTPAGGLSAHFEGELVYIEVRSALYQSYAYIVQQAAVYIPAQGYAAEVTIPMQPLSSGPSGRRDRLHIFFMDEMHRPLYEKPFVVELFISHLVQPGREGHNVLTIPL